MGTFRSHACKAEDGDHWIPFGSVAFDVTSANSVGSEQLSEKLAGPWKLTPKRWRHFEAILH